MDNFLGKKYIMVGHENFEDYLVLLGKGYIARKAALALRPEQWLAKNDDGSYTLHFKSALFSSAITFTAGQSFEESRPDGPSVNSTITIEDNKLIHVQTEADGKQTRHVREFFEDNLIITTKADGLDKVVIRRFELVK